MNEFEASVFLACVSEPNDHVLGVCIEFFGVEETADAVQVRAAGGALVRSNSELEGYLLGARAGGDLPVTAQRLAKGLARWAKRAEVLELRQVLERTRLIGATLLTRADSLWPRQLGALGHGEPLALWVHGRPEALVEAGSGIAVVGSRSATNYGEHATAMVVSTAVADGRTVVSGGAFGVDALAHRGTLSRDGSTVAVSAGGVDRLYPSGNAQLLRSIRDGGGALVSEIAPGGLPMKSRFLARNRLIAALTCATVVVEAAWRSGSLSTAHHALDIGRAVGAVPGPITSAQSAGCHKLLNEGSVSVVASAEDLRSLYAGTVGKIALSAQLHLAERDANTRCRTQQQLMVLDVLSSRRAMSLDNIVRASGLEGPHALGVLGQLEIDGAVTRDLFGWLPVTAGL